MVGAISLEDILVDRGAIGVDALERARRSGAETGQPLTSALVNLGLVSSSELADILATMTGLERVDAAGFPNAPVDAPALSPAFLRRRKLLPLALDDKTVRLAMADPTDKFAHEAIKFTLARDVEVVVAPLSDIDEAIERLYYADTGEASDGVGEGALWVGGRTIDGAGDAERLRELASDAPVIKYVNRVVARAIEAGASDIHFEAMEGRFRVRIRVDGLLRDIDPPQAGLQAAVTSRLKIMASLDIAERRLAQDGRFKEAIEGKEIDFRVSTTPTAFGESIVLRILDRKRLPGDFGALGFDEDVVAPVRRALKKPEGILLVTGPTGSGKTTTLYSALQLLNVDDRKILTVEDPIEYVLDGINQVQIDAKIGRTFASTLRSFLRQDPDILMVGEIRDRETAEIAIQASLTGHLVLSTLHTNSAAGAITRLLDMSIDDYLIASTLSAVVAQRLVRTLCPDCRESFTPETARMSRLVDAGLPEGAKLYKAKGCASCGMVGYAGRAGIIEVLDMSEAIRRLIQTRADEAEIMRAAMEEGMVPMLEYGLRQVAVGRTTIEEVMRVTREI